MTILGPILLAALMIGPALIAIMSDSDYEVAIVDDTNMFYDAFSDTRNVKYTHLQTDIDSAMELMRGDKFDAVLHIPEVAFQAPSSLRLFSLKSVNFNAKSHMESVLKNEYESLKLTIAGIDPEVLMAVETRININAVRMDKDGLEKTDYPEVSMGLGFVSGLLIYMFIFLFGSQVLRGVLEEKTSRIVEIIVSSVKPFQLMMGKVIGIGLVGLTQFLIWVVLTFAIVGGVRATFPNLFQFTPTEQVHITATQSLNAEDLQRQMETVQMQNTTAGQILEGLQAINFPVMILSFLFYFIGGYLLYAALFAAIGSAVDNEADTQQFMLPVTVPLLFSIVMMQMIIQNPSGPVAFWLSIIPLTSPVIMMIRIPFGVPFMDLAISAVLLILGFIFTTWLAAKIYRTGILMYGKKIDYAELWKWIRYR